MGKRYIYTNAISMTIFLPIKLQISFNYFHYIENCIKGIQNIFHFIQFFFTIVLCILILSKFYLFTNWCTSELP